MYEAGKIAKDIGEPLKKYYWIFDAFLCFTFAEEVKAAGEGLVALGDALMNYTYLKEITAPWAHTQTTWWPLHWQFQRGVRYFDLRVEYTEEGYRFVHGLRNMKKTVGEDLTELAEPIQQTKYETVILDFNHLYENNGDMSVESDDAGTTLPNLALSIDVLANDTDEDGDPLKVVSVSKPRFGSISLEDGGFGNVVYVPFNWDWSGEDEFTYTITDGCGGFSSAVVQITVLPKAR